MDNIKSVKRTIRLSSNDGRACEHCSEDAGLFTSVTDGINHYITKHGYQLLHVGSEASFCSDGELAHHTVAILGRQDQPPLGPSGEIAFLTLVRDSRNRLLDCVRDRLGLRVQTEDR